MTKEEWIHICRLNMEWYFVQTVFDGKPLSKEDKEWINEHMPSDDIFDDGRIEFFQENFKPIIDEDKLGNIIDNELDEKTREYEEFIKDVKFEDNNHNEFRVAGFISGWCTGFENGYRKAKEE